MILRNHYTCIALRGVFTSVLVESQHISDDISTHADFQVDGYHGCRVLLISYHSYYIAGRDNDQ